MIPEDQINMTTQWCSTGRIASVSSNYREYTVLVLLKVYINGNEKCHIIDAP